MTRITLPPLPGPGPGKPISSQALSRDGRLLVTGLDDSTALVWDTKPWLRRVPALTREALTEEQLRGLWQEMAGEDATKGYEALWRNGWLPIGATAVGHPAGLRDGQEAGTAVLAAATNGV